MHGLQDGLPGRRWFIGKRKQDLLSISLNATVFGDEAVVLVPEFSIENAAMHDVAQVMRRAERENYQVKIRRQADIPSEELIELTRLTEEWRNGDERGYFNDFKSIWGPN